MFTYLIICPLVFLGGFVDAIAGGGGLITLPAYLLAGLPAHNAIATNKISSAMGTTVSTIHFYKQGYMKMKLCLPCIPMALLGSALGANLSLLVSEQVLKIAMLIFLPVIAFYVLKNKSLTSEKEPYPFRKTLLYCLCAAFVIGVYDGFYGPGTGTFLMLVFTGLCRMSLQDSAGTTKTINLTTNVISLTVFLFNGTALITLGIIAGLCNMAGNFLGSRCFSQNGTKIVKPVILTVLAIFFIKTLSELFL